MMLHRFFAHVLRTLGTLLRLALFVPLGVAAAPGDPFAAGTPAAAQVSYELAVYYAGKPTQAPLEALKAQLAAGTSRLKRVESLPRRADDPVVVARLEADVQKNYRPPSLAMLQRFGRGLTRDEATALQSAKVALILRFAHPQKDGMGPYRASLALMAQLAQDTGGLLWDEETREVFSVGEWRKQRLDTWDGDLPDVARHSVIHAYQARTLVRAITLGMAKFGLPDVVVEDFSWSMNTPMGNLLNLLTQSLGEGLRVGPQGRCELDMKALRHARARESQATGLLPGSTGRARLTLVEGRHEDGDPDNRLVEVRFDGQPGNDANARQQALLHALYGSQDSITYIKHDDALKAASEAARARLPALQQAFARGMEPGEYILVKAPFETPKGGVEWMWVEVTAWKGDAITGLLKNDPFNVPSLHAGQQVQVSQARLFDYIRRYADGRQEGNETGRLIEKQGQSKR